MLNKIRIAIKAASASKQALAAGAISFFVFLFLFVYSTIVTTPGNSLELWLRFTPDVTKILVVLLASVMAVLFGLIVYSFQQKMDFKQAGIGAAATGSTFFAALIGSASCLSCLAAVLGFLGINTLLALSNYQQPILAAGFLIALGSVYTVSDSIANACPNGHCKTR